MSRAIRQFTAGVWKVLTRSDRVALVNSLIGAPYKVNGYGPRRWGCYGLTRHVQRECYGRDLPLIDLPDMHDVLAMAGQIRGHAEHRRWRPVERPEDGALILMSFAYGDAHHVGTYIDLDGGLVLHAIKPAVQADTLDQMRAIGWRRFRFYVPKDSAWLGSQLSPAMTSAISS